MEGTFMNGDLQELMTHIGDLHNQQMQAIGALGMQFAEHKGKTDTRLNEIEEKQKTASHRQWVHSITVLILNAGGQILKTHFGWKV